jgi:hypothetical protein
VGSGLEMTDMFKDLIADKQRVRKVSRQQRYFGRPSLEKLFQINDSKTGRDRCIYEGHVKYGYTLKEIGNHLKIQYSAAS